MQNNSIIIYATTSRERIALHDFLNNLGSKDGITMKNITSNTRGVEEIIISVIGSSAMLVLAQALRDLAQKKKLNVTMKWSDGSTLEVNEEGKDINCDDVIGYIMNGFNKSETVTSFTRKDEHAYDIKLSINNKMNN